MLNIEFHLASDEDPNDKDAHYLISVDGKIDENSSCFRMQDGEWYVRMFDKDVIEKLSKYSFDQVEKKNIYTFDFPFSNPEWEFDFTIDIQCMDFEYSHRNITITFDFEVEWWSGPYSILELALCLKSTIEGLGNSDITFYPEHQEDIISGFGARLIVKDENEIIGNVVGKFLPIFGELQSAAIVKAISNIDKNTLTTFFHFPEHIRVACKQYLVYFAQFLLDLGIEASTELKDDGGQTLFKITPIDKSEALSNIREALDIYLNAPGSTELALYEPISDDAAVIQFQGNVMHLKSQLMFSNAAIQMKDATIEALQLSNYQLRSLLNDRDSADKPKDTEDIFEGVLAVTKVETKGISINLPEILRRLKRRFGR
jgi:hypothetical protein